MFIFVSSVLLLCSHLKCVRVSWEAQYKFNVIITIIVIIAIIIVNYFGNLLILSVTFKAKRVFVSLFFVI